MDPFEPIPCSQPANEAVSESQAPGPPAVFGALNAAATTAAELQGALSENVQLAEEVLKNYEQLSLLFDFTKEIAGVTRPEELERLLLRRIAKLLRVSTLDTVSHDGALRRHDVQAGRVVDGTWHETYSDGWQAVMHDAFQHQKITVRQMPDGHCLICPLPRLTEPYDLVLATRPPDAPEFVSGDLQMAEALLTFGGNLINNSQLHTQLRRMSIEATRALVSAIDKKDHYTSGHSERVGFMSRLTGVHLGLPAEQLDQIEWSGLLHDIGKIGVREDVLNKPGKLSTEEYDEIKKHPRMGYEILKPIESLQPILDGVLHHHENPDGSGYPDGLSRSEITQFASIIHVVDVFDALSSTRSYRQAFSVERSLEIVKELAGNTLDPLIVDAFMATFARFRAEHPDMYAEMFPSTEGGEP